MLRGEVVVTCCQESNIKRKQFVLCLQLDLSITRYAEIQCLLQSNLDAWLGNLYIEVSAEAGRFSVPGGGPPVGEFDAVMSYTRGLLRMGDAMYAQFLACILMCDHVCQLYYLLTVLLHELCLV